MREFLALRRANGDLLTDEIDGKLRVFLWSSEEALTRYKERNAELMTFLPTRLTHSLINATQREPGVTVEFFLLRDGAPDAHLDDGRPISLDEIVSGSSAGNPIMEETTMPKIKLPGLVPLAAYALALSPLALAVLLIQSAPLRLVLLTFGAYFVGALLIYLGARLERGEKHFFFTHLTRDVGIAFIVAVILSVSYELRINWTLEKGAIGHVIGTFLEYTVPKAVWDEVDKNLLRRGVIRRNVSLDFEISPNNSTPGVALLDMKYRYDLYNIKSNSSLVNVEHDLLIRDPNRAGFYEWSITDAHNRNIIPLYQWTVGEPRRAQFLASVHLEPGYDFKTDTFDDARAVHVVNNRKEVMNFPGIYSLGIPELMQGTKDEPIGVTIKLPAEFEQLGITPRLETQWSGHDFTSLGKQTDGKYKWKYEGVLLPGQFFDVVVTTLQYTEAK